jgi:S-formylglutathione hydrolase FrmB
VNHVDACITPPKRWVIAAVTVVGVLLGVALMTAPAAAARSRVLIWRTPSRFVTPAQASQNVLPILLRGAGRGRLQTRIVLPPNYTPHHCWPVLYLLHGAGSPVEWTADALSAQLGAIMVLPGGGPGWYVNWWNGGTRSPGWEAWILRELVPLVDRRLPICPGRRDHSIAGLSMGAYGAVYLASQLPAYFGSVGSFSGTLNIERPEFALGYTTFPTFWGPPSGFYALGHNPTALVANLAHTRVLLEDGNGTPLPGDADNSVAARIPELETLAQSQDFDAAARAAHVPVTMDLHAGVHDWLTWGYDLTRMIAWNPFKRVAASPRHWRYSTASSDATAWGFRVHFMKTPDRILTITRTGSTLRLEGAGELLVKSPQGRQYFGQLPFDIRHGRVVRAHSGSGSPGRAPHQTAVGFRVTPARPRAHQALRISFKPLRRIPRTSLYQVTAMSWGDTCTNFVYRRVRGRPGRRVSVTLAPPAGINRGRWCAPTGMIELAVVPASAEPAVLGTFLAGGSISFRS